MLEQLPIEELPFKLVAIGDIEREYTSLQIGTDCLSKLVVKSWESKAAIFEPCLHGGLVTAFSAAVIPDWAPEDDPCGPFFAATMLDLLKHQYPGRDFSQEGLAKNKIVPGLGRYSRLLSKLLGGFSFASSTLTVYSAHGGILGSWVKEQIMQEFVRTGKPLTWEKLLARYWNVQPKPIEETSYIVLSARAEDILSCSFRHLTDCQELKSSCFAPDGDSYGASPTSLALNKNAAILYVYDKHGTRTARVHVYVMAKTRSVVYGRIYGRIPQSLLQSVADWISFQSGWDSGRMRPTLTQVHQSAPSNFYCDRTSYVFRGENELPLESVRLLHPSTICPDCGNTHAEGGLLCGNCSPEAGNTCYHCDMRIPDELTREVYGIDYCIDCFHELFSICEGCNDIIPCEDVYIAEDTTYCEYCFNRRFTYCDSCSEPVRHSETFETENNVYCESCFFDQYTICSECGDPVPLKEVYEHDGETFCHDCFRASHYVCSTCDEVFDADNKTYVVELGCCQDCMETYERCGANHHPDVRHYCQETGDNEQAAA